MGKKLVSSSKARRKRSPHSTNPIKMGKKLSKPVSQGGRAYLKNAASSSQGISMKKLMSQIIDCQEASSSTVGVSNHSYSLRKRDPSVSYSEYEYFTEKTTKTSNVSTPRHSLRNKSLRTPINDTSVQKNTSRKVPKSETNSRPLNSQNGSKAAKTQVTPSEPLHGYALRSRGPAPRVVSVTPKKKPGSSQLPIRKFEEGIQINEASTSSHPNTGTRSPTQNVNDQSCSNGRNRRKEIANEMQNALNISQQSMEITCAYKRSVVRPRILSSATAITPVKHLVSRKTNAKSQLSISQCDDESSLSENEHSESNSSVEHSVLGRINAHSAIENQLSLNESEGEQSAQDKTNPESQMGSSDDEDDHSLSFQTEHQASSKDQECDRLSSGQASIKNQLRFGKRQSERPIFDQNNPENRASLDKRDGENSIVNKTNPKSEFHSGDEEDAHILPFQAKMKNRRRRCLIYSTSFSTLSPQTDLENQTSSNECESERSTLDITNPESQIGSSDEEGDHSLSFQTENLASLKEQERDRLSSSQTSIKNQSRFSRPQSDRSILDQNNPENQASLNKRYGENSIVNKINPESQFRAGDEEDARILSFRAKMKDRRRQCLFYSTSVSTLSPQTDLENQTSSNECEGEQSTLDKTNPESQIGSSDEEGDNSLSFQTECPSSSREQARNRLSASQICTKNQSHLSQRSNKRPLLDQNDPENQASLNKSDGEHSIVNKTNPENQLGSGDEENFYSLSFRTKVKEGERGYLTFSKTYSKKNLVEDKQSLSLQTDLENQAGSKPRERDLSVSRRTYIINQVENEESPPPKTVLENQAGSKHRKRDISLLSQTYIKNRGEDEQSPPLQTDFENQAGSKQRERDLSVLRRTYIINQIENEESRPPQTVLENQAGSKQRKRDISLLSQTYIKNRGEDEQSPPLQTDFENQAGSKQRERDLSVLRRTYTINQVKNEEARPPQTVLENQQDSKQRKRESSMLDKTYNGEDRVSLQTDIEVQACSWVSGESYITNQSSLTEGQDESSRSHQVDPVSLSKEPEDTVEDENIIEISNTSSTDARYVVTACESFETETNGSRVTTPNDLPRLGRTSILKTSGSRRRSVKKLVQFHEDIIERETVTPKFANSKDERSPIPLTPHPFRARTNLVSPSNSNEMDKTTRKNNDSIFRHLQRQGNWIPGNKLSVSPLLKKDEPSASPIKFKKSPLAIGQSNSVTRKVADPLLERRSGCKARKSPQVLENIVDIQDIDGPNGSDDTESENSELLNVKSNAYILDKYSFKGPRPVIIDGSNVAFSHGISIKAKPVFSSRGIEICVNFFKQRGHRVVAFVPAAYRQRRDVLKREILEVLAKRKQLKFTTSREMNNQLVVPMVDDRWYDHRFIVQCAASIGGVIVSNEKYRDLLNANPAWKSAIGNRLLKFTFVGNDILFRQDPLRARGLDMDQILHFPK